MSIASILIFLKARSLRSLTSIDPLLNKEMKFLNALAMFEFLVLEIDKVLVGVDEGGGRIAGEAVFRIA